MVPRHDQASPVTDSRQVARASWDETWISLAQAMARRSRCDRRAVGAVIVGPDQRIVQTGYNGPPAGMAVEGTCTSWCPRAKDPDSAGVDYDNCYTVHAEVNAIAFADRTRMEGGTLYSSSAVCFACSKVISNSGISRVVHEVTDGDAHRNPALAEAFMRWCGLQVERWETGTESSKPRAVKYAGPMSRFAYTEVLLPGDIDGPK